MSKNVKTTEVINVTITNIVDGDTSGKFTEKYRRDLAKKMKAALDVDDVSVQSVKTFVMEESDRNSIDPVEATSIALEVWGRCYRFYSALGFSKSDAVTMADRFISNVIKNG